LTSIIYNHTPKQEIPTLTFRVNNVIVPLGNNITFGNYSQINISCAAANSRPGVAMFVGDVPRNLSLPLLYLGANQQNPIIFSSGNSIFSQVTQVYLTPGWAYWNRTTEVTCLVQNMTVPYNFSYSVSYPLIFNSSSSCKRDYILHIILYSTACSIWGSAIR
jgi:hypothetical protein